MTVGSRVGRRIFGPVARHCIGRVEEAADRGLRRMDELLGDSGRVRWVRCPASGPMTDRLDSKAPGAAIPY
jgi:hypothetical protein